MHLVEGAGKCMNKRGCRGSSLEAFERKSHSPGTHASKLSLCRAAQLAACDKLESLYNHPATLSLLEEVESHREIQEDKRRNRGRSMQGVMPQVRTRRVVRYMTRVAFWKAVCS